VDLSYALHAFSYGLFGADLSNALRGRDLSHKGNERSQQEHIERTVRKADLRLEKQAGRGLDR